jgi:hypothetical protein
MSLISLKLKELKSKILKSISVIPHFCIEKLYKDILDKKDKIIAKDEKYFLEEKCDSFVFNMSQKYDEQLDLCIEIVKNLRSLYINKFDKNSKELITVIIIRMLGHSAVYMQEKQKSNAESKNNSN